MNFFESSLDRRSNADAEINFQSVPYDLENNYKLTNKSNPFSDNGAWFGYYFSKQNELAFNGPCVISQEIPLNVAKSINRTLLRINGKIYHLNKKNYSLMERNGILSINAIIEASKFRIKITKKLLFSSSEDSLTKIELNVKTSIDLKIELLNELEIYKKIKYKSTNGVNNEGDWINYFKKIEFNKKEVLITFDPLLDKNEKEMISISYSGNIDLESKQQKDNCFFYTYKFKEFNINKSKLNQNFSCCWYQSFFFNKKRKNITFDETKINDIEKQTNSRWNNYKKSFINLNPREKNIAYKSIYTLISNWLAPNGKILSDIVIPSFTYSDFIGAYAWDTFKIAYGFSYIDPLLAQKLINSMFDHQIQANDYLRPWDKGMIPDCIFFNFNKDRKGIGLNWNERNTKPPLASWSVWKVFSKTKDIKWLKQIYPKLKMYQEWWLKNRKLEIDELFLSYGATTDKQNNQEKQKTIFEAISWESGMDNAPRFDQERMQIIPKYNSKKQLIAFITDQASVCLNSFYYLELISLNKIYKQIFNKQSNELLSLAKQIKQNINKYMFSKQTNFYYDIKINDLKPIIKNGLSIETFLPLYAHVATNENAKKMIKLVNKSNFDTCFPFPTVAIDNEKFEEKNYWRGPVWISFLYFAIAGFNQYKFNKKATYWKNKVINILNSKKHINEPLRENYSPINANGLATTNFSWSASLLISLIKEIE